ncbi:MAG TPA: D-2-hydroxyacid dehydrogenase [Anaerolineales bacterium]|nr:D-2-hydroxyacid dehydrogenase [Anaerolineales bacterium]
MTTPVEVLITLPFPDELVNLLRSVSPRLRINVHKASKAEEVPVETWQRVEVLYTDRVTPKPEQTSRLRWIQFHWAGLDHLAGEPIMQKPGLLVTSLSGAAAPQLAEYVLMMILSFGHRLPEVIEHQHRSDWPRDRWKRFLPRELNSSIVGIAGYGSVGREIARLVNAFGGQVLASKRNAMHPQDRGYIPEGLGDPEGELVHRLYPAQALRSMLKECDFVVVSVPLTPQTRDLIGQEELAAMKSSAYLVDVSRGGVVNQTALVNALRERKIAGAALDVFPEEPLPVDSPLWKLPNVIITPHIAGITSRYDERAVTLFAENLNRYLTELPLYNLVDPQKGY